MIETDPKGNFVIATDLGLDIVIIWTFDKTLGKLLAPQTFPTSLGAGPRHFAFHPNGVWFYLLNEESSTLAFMRYNAGTGSVQLVEEISTLPDGFVGTNFTSENHGLAEWTLHLCSQPPPRYHRDFQHQTERTACPELIDEEWTRGDYPRSFNIDPTGGVYVRVQPEKRAVTTFKVLGNGSRLKFANRYTAVGSPAAIVFL